MVEDADKMRLPGPAAPAHPAGWVGILQIDGRPWCHGRSRGGNDLWFPRTTNRPRNAEGRALFSPGRALPKLEQDGWFVATEYVTLPGEFTADDDPCGRLDEPELAKLHAILDGFYWAEP
jgi:hypothetical protein